MPEIVYHILEKLVDRLDVATVQKFFRLFRSLVFILIPICLILSGALFYRMFNQIRHAQQVLTDSILLKNESTATTYKALEALVLSNLDKDSRIDRIAVSEETKNALATLVTPSPHPPKRKITIIPGKKDENPYLLAKGSSSFILATSRALPQGFDPSMPNAVKSAFSRDYSLKDTLHDLIALDDKLCSFNGRPLAEGLGPVIQTYVISEKNIVAMCGIDKSRNQDYLNQWSADRDFTDRSYYKDTVKTRTPPSAARSEMMDKYFHPTQSYIDVAGNGIARSYCRDIVLPPSTSRNAMICFDVTASSEETKRLTEDKMRTFAGGVVEVACNASKCLDLEPGFFEWINSLSPQIASWWFPVNAQLHTIAQYDLKNEYQRAQSKGEFEPVTGDLFVLSHMEDTGAVVFSIPFGKEQHGDSAFLLCDLQLGIFEQSFFREGLWAGGCLIVAFMLLVGAFVETGLRLEQQAQVKQRLSNLMDEVPVAYCYCDEADLVRSVNPAFAHLLGHRNVVACLEKLQGKKFESLLYSDEDVAKYDGVKQQREGGTLAQFYRVAFDKMGHALVVRVFSTSLPNTLSPKKTGSDTFGLFLSEASPLLADSETNTAS